MTARWRWLKLAPFVSSAATTGRPLFKGMELWPSQDSHSVKHKFLRVLTIHG